MKMLFTVGLPILIILFSFIEVLVYNEEVLLALCFLAFIFYAYSSVGASVDRAFSDQTAATEAKFLVAFDSKFVALKSSLDSYKALVSIFTGISPFVLV